MFGAKFQKWIDIVRPNRKKSNKNKNGNGNLVSQSTSNDYKGVVYQNETSISSPARRSEVSPIQNHNGRRGWQSPSDQEIPGGSTKIDTNNYNPFLKPNNNVIKSSSFKESSLSANNNQNTNSKYNNSNRPPTNYLTTAPTTYYQMKEIDQSMMQSSNPQIIVTSKSTTSINNNSIHYNNTLHPPPLCYSTATSSSNELLDEKPKYLISSSSSSVNSAVIKGQQQNESNNNLFLTSQTRQQQQQQNSSSSSTKNESKYGKIQPINKYMSKYRFFSSKSSSTNATSSSPSTIDRYNGNSSDDFCSTIHLDALSLKGTNNTSNKCESTNVANGNSIKRNNEINNMNRNSMGALTSTTVIAASSSTSSTLQPSSMNGKIYRNGGFGVANSTSSNSTYSLIPPMTQQQQQQLQHGTNKLGYSVINHVSSPESAYSTGYSTDGNSPGGASYSPEYYINIRTGIHYFPKGNTTIDPNTNRFKSGLNRIEEKNDEQQFSHKRTESFDCTRSISTMNAPQGQLIDVLKGKSPSTNASTGIKGNCNAIASPGMSPVLRKNILMASPQFRTPSPRQRCRIKTNPWLSTVDPEPFSNIPAEFQVPTSTANVNNITNGSPNLRQRRDRDSGDSATSSSGIKSNSDESNEKFRGRKSQGQQLSDPDSDSSTEKPSKQLMSLSDFRRKYKKDTSRVSNNTNQHETDEDATLNEIGKFDESYTFEKENEFLSDSDKTDCVSDLGQEAGDECDTDDLLDVEYVGKSGQLESTDEKKIHAMLKNGSKKQQQQQQQQQDRKKKKVLSKRRSKNSESNCKSPMLSNRGCRSVGGTPVLIRRSAGGSNERRHPFEASLTNRSNSLTFSEVHMIHSRMMTISESEKALIKADLEADVKYKQLIHEAESILISMKSNLAPPISPIPPKEINPPTSTVINSPRRICNVPTNKRVEMLRNCEVDLKRELSKNCGKIETPPPSNAHSVINKRLEMLRFETSSMSAPSSPKNNRVAPIKTHITNFIYQNEIELSPRREVSPKSSPKKSPAQLRRRFLTPKQDADTDSDSDNKSTHSRASGKENSIRQVSRVKNNGVEQVAKSAVTSPPQMISFRSVICNNLMTEDMFLPQSEPLKRKIYSRNNKTIDKIQRSLDFDEEIPKKALLQKIHLMRKERQAKNKAEDDASSDQGLLANNLNQLNSNNTNNTNITADANKPLVDENIKRKLIMQTIEEIKKSLEDQSLELNELHDSDN